MISKNITLSLSLIFTISIFLFFLNCQEQKKMCGHNFIKVGAGFQYLDKRDPSNMPPNGLAVAKVPQFISFGFDDNGFSGWKNSKSQNGISFTLELAKNKNNPKGKGNPKTFDGAKLHFSYYIAGVYIGAEQAESPVFIRKAMHEVLSCGNEIGNHTYSHEHGTNFSLARWQADIDECTRRLIKPFDAAEDPENPDILKGIGDSANTIFGFRTPFLEYSDTLFTAIKNMGFWYDCSIEEGWQKDQDGTNYLWPYTLDNGSPGNVKTTQDSASPLIGKHSGLWELPCYAVIVPPDNKCTEYGTVPGLRAKLAKVKKYCDTADGKITGLDWNLWVDFQMSKPEFLATLKYTLDLRLAGNRCPMMIGVHSDIYSDSYPDTIANATPKERREALQEFIAYALSKPQVRFATNKQILDWLRNPAAME